MNITKIYLVTNCFGDPNKVYIGKTKSSTRIYQHRKSFGKCIIFTYIDEVNSLDKKDYIPLEKFWIEYFRQLGFYIQNKNKGGGGVDFCSEEHKNKIGIRNKGNNSKKVYQYDLEGNFIKEWSSIREANIGLGLPKTYTCISSCCNGIIKHSNNFIWSFNKINPQPVNTLKNKPIYQFQIDGTFIKKWDNVYSVNENIPKGNIISCLYNKTKSAGNYLWSFNNSNKKYKKRKSKNINQYDLQGKFLKEWSSALEAAMFINNNINSNVSILKACNGKLRTAFGFIWKFNNQN